MATDAGPVTGVTLAAAVALAWAVTDERLLVLVLEPVTDERLLVLEPDPQAASSTDTVTTLTATRPLEHLAPIALPTHGPADRITGERTAANAPKLAVVIQIAAWAVDRDATGLLVQTTRAKECR
jgi:hypothetical protein